MKKHITIAALLAAGTAFANAADLTLLSGFDGFSATDGAYKSNLGTQSLTLTLGGGSVSDAGVLTTSTTTTANKRSYIDLSSLTLGSDGYTVSVSFKSSTISGSAAFATLSTDTQDNAIVARNYSGQVIIMNNGASDTADPSYSTGITTSAPFTLTFAVAADGAYTLFVTQGETTQSLTRTNASHADETPTALYLGAWGSFDTQHKSESAISKVSVWSGTATASDLPAIINVPEPSAFGLLAGVGALALVASRRRRAK